MNYRFTEIFDIPALTRLCNNFTQLTGKATALLDLEGNVHVSSGWQEICTDFHRIHPVTSKRCGESDTILANQLNEERPYNIYQCKNGLVDVAVPVYVGERHLANFFTGQFLFEQPDEELFANQASEFDFPTDVYMEALKKVPIYSPDEVKATMNFLVELTEVIGSMGIEKLKKLEIERQEREALEFLLDEKSKKLSSVHKKYQAALSVSGVGIWEWTINSDSIYWSEETISLWGLTQEIFHNSLAQVRNSIHPEDLNMWEEDVNACLKGEKEHDIQFRVVHPDSSIHWVHVIGSAERDELDQAVKMSGVVFDVTDRKNTQQALHDSEYNLRQAQKVAHIGSWELEIASGQLSWSDEIFQIFEVNKDALDVSYEAFISFIHPDDREFVNSVYLKSVASGEPYEVEHRLLFDNGKVKYVRELGITSYNSNGKPILSRGTLQDITEKKLLALKIEGMAYHDALTGLPNRRLFDDRFKQVMAISKRSKHYGAVLFLDLDKFKKLNDTYGHDAGDLLLQQVGQRISNVVREVDTVARIGGDEFLVLLAELSKQEKVAKEKATVIAHKICNELSKKYVITKTNNKTIEHSCSASIGVALFYDQNLETNKIIEEADKAMYQAKNSRHNRVCVYHE